MVFEISGSARDAALPAECTVGATFDLAAAYRDHAGMLRSRLLAASRDPALAEDVCQEAFVRLLEETRRGMVPDCVAAWLTRVAMNLVISRARHAQVVERHEARLEAPYAEPSPEDEIERRDALRAVQEAMAGLAEPDRAALLMAAHGSTGAEIAEHLGRTELGARALLSRARARLRLRMVPA